MHVPRQGTSLADFVADRSTASMSPSSGRRTFSRTRHVAGVQAQQIVQHEHLAVAAAPAPMPMVGIRTDAVIGRRWAGMHSNTMANARKSPPPGRRPAVAARPLHAVAAELVDALRTQPAMSHYRDARRNQRRNHFGLLDAPFKLHGLAARLLQDAAGVLDGLVRPRWKLGNGISTTTRACRTARPTISA